jgi:hypothetical protein
MKHRGMGSIFARGGTPDDKGRLKTGAWWIRYYRNGKGFSESSGNQIKAKAEAMLKKRIGELANEEFISPSDRRVTVAQVYQLLLDNYEMNGKATLQWAKWRWEGRLKAAFGDLRASQLSTDLLNKYVLACQADKLSNATINRDMAALKGAYNLAHRSTPRKVFSVPRFPHLDEAAPRKGFVEETQYREMVKHSPELWLRSLLAVAYSLGSASPSC